jgi:septal ring factor EnvC (AmiA/AmiB activator)
MRGDLKEAELVSVKKELELCKQERTRHSKIRKYTRKRNERLKKEVDTLKSQLVEMEARIKELEQEGEEHHK